MIQYRTLVVQIDRSLEGESYNAALAAINSIPGVHLTHYVLKDQRGGAHLKSLGVGEDGQITVVQG